MLCVLWESVMRLTIMQDETGGPGWVDNVAEGVLKHTYTAILICFQGSSAGGWDLMFFL
jgi:hypothetical protein